MYLRYYLDDQGKRVYTFKFHDPAENPTLSAHPGKCPFEVNHACSSLFTRRCLPKGENEVQGALQAPTHPEASHGVVSAVAIN